MKLSTAGTCSHLSTCFSGGEDEDLKVQDHNGKKRKRNRLDATGPFHSPVRFNQPEQRLTILQSQREGPLWKLNIAARNAGNRQFLVFYTTAYTVQLGTGDTGGERRSGATSQACEPPKIPTWTERARRNPRKVPAAFGATAPLKKGGRTI